LAVFDVLLQVLDLRLPTAAALRRQMFGDVSVDEVLNRRSLTALALLAGRVAALVDLSAQLLRPGAGCVERPFRRAADLDQPLPAGDAVQEHEGLSAAGIGAQPEAADCPFVLSRAVPDRARLLRGLHGRA